MKVLVGYDGSASSDAIFGDLKYAGLPLDGEAKVVSVADLLPVGSAAVNFGVPTLDPGNAQMIFENAEAHRKAVIQETGTIVTNAIERLSSVLPRWEIEPLVRVGTPAWELLDAADELDPDLIIVGSQGRSAIGRFFLGSVSKKLVTDARCSVRVSRTLQRDGAGTPPRILIGVDGSPAAEEAVYAVGQRVWPSGTVVRLVSVDDSTPPTHVTSRLPQLAAMINHYFQSRHARVDAMLKWATEQLSAIDLKVSVIKKKGVAADILLEEARSWNADSIFVGMRDFKSAFERFRLGSVSTAVVTNAHCSVEIVRPPAVIEV
jgi:nucleotide-binding universal stress UspA family protein